MSKTEYVSASIIPTQLLDVLGHLMGLYAINGNYFELEFNTEPERASTLGADLAALKAGNAVLQKADDYRPYWLFVPGMSPDGERPELQVSDINDFKMLTPALRVTIESLCDAIEEHNRGAQ